MEQHTIIEELSDSSSEGDFQTPRSEAGHTAFTRTDFQEGSFPSDRSESSASLHSADSDSMAHSTDADGGYHDASHSASKHPSDHPQGAAKEAPAESSARNHAASDGSAEIQAEESASSSHGDTEVRNHAESGQIQEGSTLEIQAEEQDDKLTEGEEKELALAEDLKLEGNALFGQGEWQGALDKYREALDTAPEKATEKRSIYASNAGAANLKLGLYAEAAKDCTSALKLGPPRVTQLKALLRRAQAYEKLDDQERAFGDYEKVVELDPSHLQARSSVVRLRPAVEAKREKMKEEMIGKLKDLGNTVLGKFGMSLDNFKAEKDPATGSYSIAFNQ